VGIVLELNHLRSRNSRIVVIINIINDTCMTPITWTLIITLVATLPVAAQAPAPAPAEPRPGRTAANGASAESGELPVSLRRIQRGLATTPVIRVDDPRPVFRVEVFGRKPTVEDLLGRDYLRGPVPYGGMTHQEFLHMVTPPEFRGYAMFTNREAMTIAATSIALQWALQKAVDKFKSAKAHREREAARKEVLDALAALERARRDAGK
jgi:hypothetical protein